MEEAIPLEQWWLNEELRLWKPSHGFRRILFEELDKNH